jgi:hypothetical protein
LGDHRPDELAMLGGRSGPALREDGAELPAPLPGPDSPAAARMGVPPPTVGGALVCPGVADGGLEVRSGALGGLEGWLVAPPDAPGYGVGRLLAPGSLTGWPGCDVGRLTAPGSLTGGT